MYPISRFVLTAAVAALPLLAQFPGLSLPPSGDNQKASVTQYIGPVRVTIDYSSPRVTLNGQDRRGKLWGQLVPYGMTNLGFGTAKLGPWRAGANENTVFTVSESVTIEGQLVASSEIRSTYTSGERVFHDKFGYGTIAAVEGNKLTIDFEKSGRKHVVDSFVERH